MCDIRLLVPQRHWPHESLHLHRLPRETFPNKCRLCYHPLPNLALALPGLQNLEHLVLRNASHFRQRHGILCSLVFSFLLDRC